MNEANRYDYMKEISHADEVWGSYPGKRGLGR